MKQVNWNGRDVLLVEVPKMTEWDGCEIRGRTGRNCLLSFYGNAEAIELPVGDWQIAFASPLSPTESEASCFVEVINVARHGVDGWPPIIAYRLYGNIYQPITDPIESLHSRIRSEGFEQPERVVVLIKK